MPMELELGMLISKLNPYDVDVNMHLAPGDPESIKGVLDQEILVRDVVERAKRAAEANMRQVSLEVETRERDYLAWQFKDLPRLVKRAVRIEYRHLYRKTGVWVTDHLLIGYEGSNGGG